MPDQQRESVTINKPVSKNVVAREVASALDVSISTVSRAFTPNAVIADRTRRRVLQKAAELGYEPNPHAQSLKTNRSGIVGLIVSDLANPFYPEVLIGLTEALEQRGFSVMLFCRLGGKSLDEAFQSAFRYQPDVLVVLAATMSSAAIESATEAGTRVVLFNRYVPGKASFAVTCDNESGGETVADYLIDRQLTRLAYVAGDPDATTNRDRKLGFMRACRRRGIPKPRIAAAHRFTHDAGLIAGRALLRDESEPLDAVFCANDVLSLGVLDAASEFGVAIPDALSVIGFDDIKMADWASYQLTTYRQPVEEMIAATADIVSELVQSLLSTATRITIPGRIVTRRTVRAAQ
jgi:DNA-binding LacI/PurR family transcriptional regulator